MFSLVKSVQWIAKLSLELLARWDRAKAKETITEGVDRLAELERSLSDDPLRASRDFWGADPSSVPDSGVRDPDSDHKKNRTLGDPPTSAMPRPEDTGGSSPE